MESDSLSLVNTAKGTTRATHHVTFPHQNPYGESLIDILATELRQVWLYRTILLYDRTYELDLPKLLKCALLEGQAGHVASTREIKKLLVRQRMIADVASQPFNRRAYLLSMYSACALPGRARALLTRTCCSRLEGRLRERYCRVIAELSPIADRSTLETLADRSEMIATSILACSIDS